MNARVLIADDDYDNRTILRQVLEAAGCTVREAVDGEEAVATAAEWGPELIFLDISMPKLDGLEAAKRIRQDPRGAEVTIFAFTAHALDGDKDRALSAGCDDYITKPCMPRDIAAKVRNWAAAPKRGNSHV